MRKRENASAEVAPSDQILVTIKVAGARLSLGKDRMYKLINRGEILAVNSGRSRRIVVESLQAYVDRLCAEQQRGSTR